MVSAFSEIFQSKYCYDLYTLTVFILNLSFSNSS